MSEAKRKWNDEENVKYRKQYCETENIFLKYIWEITYEVKIWNGNNNMEKMTIQ